MYFNLLTADLDFFDLYFYLTLIYFQSNDLLFYSFFLILLKLNIKILFSRLKYIMISILNFNLLTLNLKKF